MGTPAVSVASRGMVSSAPIRGHASNEPLHPLAVAHSEWGLWLESYLKVKDGYFPSFIKAEWEGGYPGCQGAQGAWWTQCRAEGRTVGLTAGCMGLSMAVACGGHGVGYVKEMSAPRLQAGQASGRRAILATGVWIPCVCVCVLPTSLHWHLPLW